MCHGEFIEEVELSKPKEDVPKDFDSQGNEFLSCNSRDEEEQWEDHSDEEQKQQNPPGVSASQTYTDENGNSATLEVH